MSTSDETKEAYPECFTTVDGYMFRLPAETDRLPTGRWMKMECLIKKQGATTPVAVVKEDDVPLGAGYNPFLVDMNSTASGSNIVANPQYATVADVSCCLELLKALSLKVDEISQSVVPANQAHQGVKDDNEFSQRFPIATKDAFDDLEAALRDSSFANRFVEHFVSRYEQIGQKWDLTKLMYYFLDLTLTKDFAHACSWTGAAKGQTKLAFEKYTNFLKQFDRLIKLASSNHKITDTSSFIKKALSSSGQRLKNEREKARRDSTL